MGVGFSELLQLEYSRATPPSQKASFCENKEREGYPVGETAHHAYSHPPACDKGMGERGEESGWRWEESEGRGEREGRKCGGEGEGGRVGGGDCLRGEGRRRDGRERRR